jgi:hypothetical protein
LKDFAEILGGSATIGLSIPGEAVTGGASTVGIISGGGMILDSGVGLIDCSK